MKTPENPAPVSPPSTGSPAGPPMNSIEESVLRRIPLEIVALSAVLAMGAVFIFDPMTALLFFGGGLLATLSFLWMKSAVVKILARDKAGALRTGVAMYAVRFILILIVFLLIILAYPNRILAFAAGFSMVVPAFVIEMAVALTHLKKWKV